MREAPSPAAGRASAIAIIAAAVLVVVAFGLYQAGGGPTPEATASPTRAAIGSTAPPAPSLDVPVPSEPLGPTFDPASVDICTRDQLALMAGGWGGATGSMAGGAAVVNVSSATCRVSGQPAFELLDKAGKVIATGVSPSPGEPVVLLPGGVADATTVWQNWCGDEPARPLSLRVSLVDMKGTLRAVVLDWSQAGGVGGSELSSLPRCDVEGAPSTIVAPTPFAAPEPPELADDAPACVAEDLAGFLGTWGAAAGTDYAGVTVFNQSGEPCLIEGSPPLELRDARGGVVASGERWPDAGFVQVPAGWAVETAIGFADWCVPPPKLPLQLDLRIGTDRLAISPTSSGSNIAIPACFSDPPNDKPDLFSSGPFALPGSELP